VRAYLIHYIDKGMGVVSGEMPVHIDPVIIREDRRDQRDALGRGEGMADQTFPGWIFAVDEKAVRPATVDRWANETLTG
jgi:hypothetical protein